MVVHLVNAVQRVKADDVGVPVIVNNHVHLSDTGNFVIDLDAVQMFGGKVVPVVKVMKKAEGVTEQLKAENQMEWVGRMNSIRSRAEEVVLSELVYC